MSSFDEINVQQVFYRWDWPELEVYLNHLNSDVQVGGVKFADWHIDRKLAADPICVVLLIMSFV